METGHLQEFLLLAELGSSYMAADKLFISQSSLVRHIQTIEEEMGMPLFDRTRRGFALNEAGKVFEPFARKIVSEQERCYQALHRGDLHEKVVRITSEAKIIDLIIDFWKEYPDYSIDYHVIETLEKDVHEGNVDVAFLTHSRITMDDIVAIPFYRECVLVLLYEGHPLYNRERISLKEIKDETLIGLTTEVFSDNMDFDKYFRQAGFRMGPNVTVPNVQDLLRMVREKMGIALVHGGENEVSEMPGLRTVPIDPKMEYDVNMCYRSDIYRSKATMDFIEYARKWRIRHKEVKRGLLSF